MRTYGMIALAGIGLLGILFRMQGWPAAQWLIAVGFFGFPVLYGYITWPEDRRWPDAKWLGTMAMMLLFGLIIFFR